MSKAGKRRIRKHRRQVKNGKAIHKLVGGRTGGKMAHQLKSGHRGKGGGKARNVVYKTPNKAVAAWFMKLGEI